MSAASALADDTAATSCGGAAQPSPLPNVSVDAMVSGEGLRFPHEWPLISSDFSREDEAPDAEFYCVPRLVHHADPGARYALTLYYTEVLEGLQGTRGSPADVLELCASWASHLPGSADLLASVVGVGMCAGEMGRNGALTAYSVHDLNAAPAVAIDADAAAGAFDAVVCALGLGYLVRPVAVLADALRLLRPGGVCILSFTRRLLFPAKAARVWAAAADGQRLWLAAAALHFARVPGWRFVGVEALDLSPDPGRSSSDPLYVVRGVKAREGDEEGKTEGGG